MANRIITFQLDPIQKRLQDNPYEVFLDVSMYSKPKNYTVSAIYAVYPTLSIDCTVLKADTNDDDVAIVLDDGINNNIELVLYGSEKDYVIHPIDESIMNKYYLLLATEYANEEQSCVITEKTGEYANMYINLLSSDDYANYSEIYVKETSYHSHLINRLVNVNAIRNSLNNIFTWIPGERVLLPEFGSNLRKLLYEGITDYNVEQIIAEIKHVVSKWEPRVQITNIIDVSTVDDHENNTVHIKIVYIIPGLSDALFEYDYILSIVE